MPLLKSRFRRPAFAVALLAATAMSGLVGWEVAPAAALFGRPLHPYARALLAATPSLDPDIAMPAPLPGEPPGATRPDHGCVFAPRCPHAEPACREEDQVLAQVEPERSVACRRWAALL